jgi:hypothetical protein
MQAMILFFFQWWRQIALVAVLAAIYGYHANEVRKARNEGIAVCEARASADVDRRIKNALEAERGVIFGNGNGRLSNDGFKRNE